MVKPLNLQNYYNDVLTGRIKQTKKKTFHILFIGVNSDDDVYAPSLVSRYLNGKKSVTKELAGRVVGLNNEELKARIEALGIQDPDGCVKLAKDLVQSSNLTEDAKVRLFNLYDENDPYLFLGIIFREAVKYAGNEREKADLDINNNSELDESSQDTLVESRNSESLLKKEDGVLNKDRDVSFEEFLKKLEIDYPIEKIDEYNSSYVKHYLLDLPKDIPCLLKIAYEICRIGAVISLDIADFYAATHILPETFLLQDGRLEYHEVVCNDKECIENLLDSISIKSADSIILFAKMGSNWTLEDVCDITNIVQSAAGDTNIFFGSLYDETLEDGAIIHILVHVLPSEEKVGAKNKVDSSAKEEIRVKIPPFIQETMRDKEASDGSVCRGLNFPPFLENSQNKKNSNMNGESSIGDDEDQSGIRIPYIEKMVQKGDGNQQFGYASNVIIHND